MVWESIPDADLTTFSKSISLALGATIEGPLDILATFVGYSSTTTPTTEGYWGIGAPFWVGDVLNC